MGREARAYSYEPCHLSDVVYSHDEMRFQSELGRSISHLAEYIAELLTSILDGEDDAPDAATAYPAFVECISRYKHRAFVEEHEVRIVAFPTPREKYPILSRMRGSQIAPEKPRKLRSSGAQYIELFGWPDITLPIERIIVGPHKEKSGRELTVREMVEENNIQVTVSDIPFVG
jgi:hypothetical protein